jgi:hypothetical protein
MTKFCVIINSVPHKDQRYDTCGDWHYAPAYWESMSEPNGLPSDCIFINVSQLKDRKEMILIAIHELIEAVLCEAKGITQAQVDEFDLSWEHMNKVHQTDKEPGDHHEAPYYHAHQIASGIERILAAELGVDWSSYEQHLQDLSK